MCQMQGWYAYTETLYILSYFVTPFLNHLGKG